jgi:hypothetical protein
MKPQIKSALEERFAGDRSIVAVERGKHNLDLISIESSGVSIMQAFRYMSVRSLERIWMFWRRKQ